MANEAQHQAPHVDKLDADAVCAQCGTVNPEGVFICKTCGNNLRDQRAARMAADRQLAGEAEPKQRGRLALGVITVVGLVLLIFAGLQPDKVAGWLVSITNPTPSVAAVFWEGPQSAAYEELEAGLEARPVTPEEVEAVRSGAFGGEGYDGRYVLMRGGQLAGSAMARSDGNFVLFAAKLVSGDEIRGKGQFREEVFYADWSSAGIRSAGDYYSAAGYASMTAPGAYSGVGRTELSEEFYDFAVMRVPE